MARSPPCSEEGLNRGAWTSEEDRLLVEYVKRHGKGKWRKLAEDAGLKRSGKSCRLRWLNYLRPELKRGNISPDEEDLIIRLHKLLGNRWSLIAGRLPGRSDNEIKNYWNTTLKKKANISSSSYDNKDNNYAVNSPSSSSEKIVNDDDNTGKAEVENSSMNLCHATTPSPSELYRCDDLDRHDDINFGLEGLSFNRSAIMGSADDNSNNNNDNNNVGEMNDYGTPSASASGSGTNNCSKSDNVLEKILMDLDGDDHVVSDSEFWLAINDWIGEDSNKT